ncbi:hypothetical protein VTL71DRAFT_453 [Oculimacula yallundae]|uniref:Uncharacterized protein n=1 Tax=Oculimacula yallundae TaxID=86028 RepID=A0ABR4D081_9HELO
MITAKSCINFPSTDTIYEFTGDEVGAPRLFQIPGPEQIEFHLEYIFTSVDLTSVPSAALPLPQQLTTTTTTTTTTTNFGELPPRYTMETAAKKKQIYTCKVKQTCTSQLVSLRNGAYVTQSLALGKGQEGFTPGEIELDQNAVGWQQVAVARTDIVGWVRESDLEMGQVSQAVKIVNTGERPTAHRATKNSGSVLYKTISLLCEKIVAEKDYLAGILPQISCLVTMPTAVRKKMDGGDFTLNDLWEMPPGNSWVTSATDERVIIYVILFKGLDGKVDSSGHGFYGGKTENAAEQQGAHWRSLKNPKSEGHLYSTTRQKGDEDQREYRMLVLCDYTSEKDPSRRNKTSILTSDEMPDSSFLGTYYFDRARARVFTEMMTQVCVQTGWKVPAGKKLNWKTPLAEASTRTTTFTCTVFTPDTATGPIRSYKSGPRNVRVSKFGNGVTLFHGDREGRGGVEVAFPPKVDIPEKVTLTVEIYSPNRRHPAPYARFPEPGPFNTWGELNAIGIKVEWQDKSTGKWMMTWLQPGGFCFTGLGWSQERQKDMSTKTAEAYPYASAMFVKLLLIRDTLLQVEYEATSNRPVLEFLRRGPPIVVKVIEYNHLDQTTTVSSQQPRTEKPPKLVSVDQNRVALRLMYGEGVFSSPQPGLLHRNLDTLPATCAVCATHYDTPGYVNLNEVKCSNSATDACYYCKWLRRPCVWMIVSELRRTDLNNRYRFIRPPIRDQGGIQEIAGPSSDFEYLYRPTEEELVDNDRLVEELNAEAAAGNDDHDNEGY